MNLLGKALTAALIVCVGMWTITAVHVSQAQMPTPPDAVKEYAMNRLCQISYLECRRLAQVAATTEKAQ